MRISQAAILFVTILPTACEAGSEHAIPPGRFAYRATHASPSGNDTTISGVLVIEYSSADSIAGTWRVPALLPELLDGRWQEGAYHAIARTRYLGLIEHRIVGGEADGPRCDGAYTWVDSSGRHRTAPVDCSLTREVPFELEPVETIPAVPATGSAVPPPARELQSSDLRPD